ncbi:hypothetical protein HYDPIDRAFT_26673 [Hydnomerulius pinastri MD-312]|nr:hypothetical protein HYDPIDRAFT_26673 [Hydnomerulius pinastri MD-312]
MGKSQTPRKQKRKSLASRDHFARLIREATVAEPEASPSSSQPDASATSDTKGKAKATPTLNYANVLLIERFQAAVENRTAICQRLEQLVRNSNMYTPSAQTRLIRCLRDDFIRGDKTRRIIDDLKHSDFISTPPGEEEIEYMRKEVSESTRMLLEGSQELHEIGDHIAAQFS